MRTSFSNWNKTEDKLGIIGLHACADLSVTILQTFFKLDFVDFVAIMPCCYHRLELDDCEHSAAERFVNFPSSNSLKCLYEAVQGHRFLRRPFLRLACQYSIGSRADLTAEDIDRETTSFMLRAVLQYAAHEGMYT